LNSAASVAVAAFAFTGALAAFLAFAAGFAFDAPCAKLNWDKLIAELSKNRNGKILFII
jgi:hypothetical protein